MSFLELAIVLHVQCTCTCNLLELLVPTLILGCSNGISVTKFSDTPEKCIVATDDSLASSPCTLDIILYICA